jgi:hypothetical protein
MEWRGPSLRYGYLQGNDVAAATPGMLLSVDNSQPFTVRTGGTPSFVVGTARSYIYGTVADALRMHSTNASNWIEFYNSGDTATVRGTCGLFGNAMRLWCHTNAVQIGTETAQAVAIYTNGAERTRWDGSGAVLFGKITNDVNLDGIQFTGIAGTTSSIHSTNAALNTPSMICNKIGAGAATGADYIGFRYNNAQRGSITSTSGGVAFNTTSDYRLKDELGPLSNALSRVRQLRPIRYRLKSEPEADGCDGFLAHEVAEVVPEAVTGGKDAVDDEGEIVPQQLDHSKLVPILVAAVQELTAKVQGLEAELAILKGAA